MAPGRKVHKIEAAQASRSDFEEIAAELVAGCVRDWHRLIWSDLPSSDPPETRQRLQIVIELFEKVLRAGGIAVTEHCSVPAARRALIALLTLEEAMVDALEGWRSTFRRDDPASPIVMAHPGRRPRSGPQKGWVSP